MKVYVKNGDRNIRILLPTVLLFNPVTAVIAFHSMRKYTPERLHDLSLDQLNALFTEFRRIKEKHSRWELVNVEGSDGQIVRVIL